VIIRVSYRDAASRRPGLAAALSLGRNEMIVDFQHHYTPPELMERGHGIGTFRLDKNVNPN
jgi:hypothetical protein